MHGNWNHAFLWILVILLPEYISTYSLDTIRKTLGWKWSRMTVRNGRSIPMVHHTYHQRRIAVMHKMPFKQDKPYWERWHTSTRSFWTTMQFKVNTLQQISTRLIRWKINRDRNQSGVFQNNVCDLKTTTTKLN